MIFLDLILKDMTAFDVLLRLRSVEATKGIPVIINTSADLSDEDRRRLLPESAAIISKSAVPAEEAFVTIRNALMRAGLSQSSSSSES